MALIPPVGTSGLFQLSAPFNTKLQANMSYRCDAVRSIADFLKEGIDPFEEVYQPNSLSKATYDAEVAASVRIITLVSSSDHWVHVPSTYITAYPDINGVPYTVMVLGVELGAIPNYKNLAGLKAAITNLVRDTIGINPTVREVVISPVEKISQADHDALEAARTVLITNSQTDRAKLIAKEAELAALRTQVQQLEAYLKSNPPT